MKKSFLAKLISIIFIIILVGGIISLPFIPILYDMLKDPYIQEFKTHHITYQLAFYTCFIICLIIVFKLNEVFNNVYQGSPFNKKVENSLKVSAVLFFILSIIVIGKALFIPTLLSFVVAFICLIASLSFYVLAEVIKKAIEYKDEIDYTV